MPNQVVPCPRCNGNPYSPAFIGSARIGSRGPGVCGTCNGTGTQVKFVSNDGLFVGGQTAHGVFGKQIANIVRDLKLLAFVAVVIVIALGAQKLGLIHGEMTRPPQYVASSVADSASDVVIRYYDRWNARDYRAMYSVLSNRMKASHPSFSDYAAAHEAVSNLRLDAAASTDPSVVKFTLASDQLGADGHVVTSHFVGHWNLVRADGEWRLDDEQIAEVRQVAAPALFATTSPSHQMVATAEPAPTNVMFASPAVVSVASTAPAFAAAPSSSMPAEAPTAVASATVAAAVEPTDAPAASTPPSNPCATKGASVVLMAPPFRPIDASITSDISVYVAPNGSATGVAGNVPPAVISEILSASFVNCTGSGQNVLMRINQGQLTLR